MTRNTEYHFRDGFCIAVRDRRTGDFLRGHLALHGRIEAGIKFFSNGGMAPNVGEPRCGESLYFASHGRDLVTSPLEGVERPPCETVRAYPQARGLGPEPRPARGLGPEPRPACRPGPEPRRSSK